MLVHGFEVALLVETELPAMNLIVAARPLLDHKHYAIECIAAFKRLDRYWNDASALLQHLGRRLCNTTTSASLQVILLKHWSCVTAERHALICFDQSLLHLRNALILSMIKCKIDAMTSQQAKLWCFFVLIPSFLNYDMIQSKEVIASSEKLICTYKKKWKVKKKKKI